ncbi:hypothetical protein [Hymenobacter terricola]|uniref:hypothetical protein n=1 Tax=Hymenobacter terricola TaxID=2819236 RepID=UPI001B30D134|nr:hypothetical protein [Hymenobacter terricola]
MRYLFPLFLVLSCLLTLLPGCEPKEDLVQTAGSLEMGADTVLFDTVFTTIRTVTKRLWVYNRNSGAVKTDVSLTGTAGTPYSLLINGDAGPSASGVTVRGKDSLLVLVRAVLGDNGQATVAKKFLVTDEVHFRTNGNDQNVKLVAYGQNAYFHRADIIRTDKTWATDKPHVIINSPYIAQPGAAPVSVGVYVAAGATLRIPKGARIYSHAGGLIQVDGTLRVNDDFVPGTGTTDTVKATNPNIVRFQGDRLEPFYADVPGQWGGIVFTGSTQNNSIRYAEIKNATFGAFLYNPNATAHPKLTVDNTVIRNISGSNLSFANATASTGGGIISYSGDVTATNCLFTNCGEYAVLGAGGGIYNFNFCTFANYTPSFHRETSSLTFTNKKVTDGTPLPLTLNLLNSIVWGSFEDELFLENNGAANYTVNVLNTLLRTKEYQATTSTTGKPGLANTAYNNLINVADPLFVRTSLTIGKPDYRLQDSSPAKRRAPLTPPSTPSNDLLNVRRSNLNLNQTSLGAYE